jgi:SAM-dependent methyltransferase
MSASSSDRNTDINYPNKSVTTTVELVDATNRDFYSRFPYPWPPTSFPRLERTDFESIMLNQSVGDFDHHTIPAEAVIWVAGCGTNQAVYTALKFPQARVIGSDISPTSLEMAQLNAKKLNISNLELREESLNNVTYSEAFDYILNTGVIHHNANPRLPLKNVARALKADGVLEIMVYNQYHRIYISAFQAAVRTMYSDQPVPSHDAQFEIAKALATTEPVASNPYMVAMKYSSETEFADAFIQPVEFSYTVSSLRELLNSCDLELVLPCSNQYDRSARRAWSIQFGNSELQEKYSVLPDVARWQLANLIFTESSPMLWFFARHRRNCKDRRFELSVNEEFLNRTFTRPSTKLTNYFRGPSDLNYRSSSLSVPYPGRPQDPLLERILGRVDGKSPMRVILRELGVDLSNLKCVTDIRVQSTTSLSPYLEAQA